MEEEKRGCTLRTAIKLPFKVVGYGVCVLGGMGVAVGLGFAYLTIRASVKGSFDHLLNWCFGDEDREKTPEKHR